MTGSQFQTEVDHGDRFEFGKNWARFLTNLNDDRIDIAQRSLVNFLGEERLDGKSFLDVGSGSGLFSLVARRLGARVRSFDFDPSSVACTRELKRRYFPQDPDWVIEEGSILDRSFVDQLGTYDIVYSWGVLHHTGQMFVALDNVKQLVAMHGKLFIAIYNDLGQVTDKWARTKRLYNRLPFPLAHLFALSVIAREEGIGIAVAIRRWRLAQWLKGWTEYDKLSTRGMSKWHDWIDWIGGWPYERATVESIVDFYSTDGFRLVKLEDRSSGYGCNEYVFRKEAPLGTVVDARLPGGNSLARQFGWRIAKPFRTTNLGVVGKLSTELPQTSEPAWVMCGDRLMGPAVFEDGRSIVIQTQGTDIATLQSQPFFVLKGQLMTLNPPFTHAGGSMWMKPMPDLEHLADRVGAEQQSPVFVLEDRLQLPRPHSIHASIRKSGRGQFSHWGAALYFSTSDSSDPNKNGRKYELFAAGSIGRNAASESNPI